MRRTTGLAPWALALALACVGGASLAHPHILVEARAHITLDAQGRITAVENIWDFDKAFSAFAIQGYDSAHNGLPTRADLQPLAKINMESLKDYQYFSQIKLDGQTFELENPSDFYDVFENETLEVHFVLHPAAPIDLKGRAFEFNVYDPEYFAAIRFAPKDPVQITGAASACTIELHRPGVLDPKIAAIVATIPASQRELPPDLFAATAQLINGALIQCPEK
ncbi:MAG: DUF1007 family protein [Hyphomicrobiales bacterium]|nr:DUF1007 family protein [Hyphomicrobiales bacterium]MDE2115434.1 DUF1007 family protein [Hyphomicrobiales bacterium]